ncbi:hypothetical protein H3C61_01495 [Candidatus Gracilibacteria bacterium]|nr:hypothetical protein [Candidatus Gracilibacteria bacterium]
MINIDIYGLKVLVKTDDIELKGFIKRYYSIFLVDKLSDFDIEINLDRYGYFSKNLFLDDLSQYTTIGDSVKIDFNGDKYYFEDREIKGLIKFLNNGKIVINGFLKPRKIHHIVHILLQGFDRIDKYYNRFIIKSLIHDIIFILLEKKLAINILHATAVTNGINTFIFTGLGGSGKSTLASSFLSKKGYKILSDNYCLVKENKLYPFPELPRITKETTKLLGIEEGKKADGIKTYLNNELSGIKKEYKIDKVFICSYGNNLSINKLDDKEYIFENLFSINNYTKEFPEYLNLSLLSLINKFNTGKQRLNTLSTFVENNNFYLLQNDKNIEFNLEKIENV